MNQHLVGSIYMYERFCIKFLQSRMKSERYKIYIIGNNKIYIIGNNKIYIIGNNKIYIIGNKNH